MKQLVKQVKEQYEQDLLAVKSLKECFEFFENGVAKRDDVTDKLRSLPSTYVHNLSLFFTFDVRNKDLELMAAIKDVIKTVESSMELKLSFLLSNEYVFLFSVYVYHFNAMKHG
ncbi:hypothetical protein L1987_68174 [Smallanthus sonchifolius]|uniref:Uncharacterized protein n=1 Tax=Smallanthus sonchifolius TaxID=185202 RepID=A0ACB9B4V9_9ASTR|nr:hypothetical protein L1987_68174 [Smallanthus sonchifolius]